MSQHRSRQSVRERPEWQCRYRGGECTNARATKIDGSLHHLCQDHRLRANWNQRVSQQRQRRLRRRRNTQATVVPTTATRRQEMHRRQTHRSDQLRRLDYSEWLQILDSLEWHEPFIDTAYPSEATMIPWEDELFAPLAAQLQDSPSDPDASLSDDIFFFLGSDVSSHMPSLSGDDAIAGSDSN